MNVVEVSVSLLALVAFAIVAVSPWVTALLYRRDVSRAIKRNAEIIGPADIVRTRRPRLRIVR